jgi:hypothetical protein
LSVVLQPIAVVVVVVVSIIIRHLLSSSQSERIDSKPNVLSSQPYSPVPNSTSSENELQRSLRFKMADGRRFPATDQSTPNEADLHLWSIYRQNLNADLSESAIGASSKSVGSERPFGHFQLKEQTVSNILNHPKYGPRLKNQDAINYLRFGLPRAKATPPLEMPSIRPQPMSSSSSSAAAAAYHPPPPPPLLSNRYNPIQLSRPIETQLPSESRAFKSFSPSHFRLQSQSNAFDACSAALSRQSIHRSNRPNDQIDSRIHVEPLIDRSSRYDVDERLIDNRYHRTHRPLTPTESEMNEDRRSRDAFVRPKSSRGAVRSVTDGPISRRLFHSNPNLLESVERSHHLYRSQAAVPPLPPSANYPGNWTGNIEPISNRTHRLATSIPLHSSFEARARSELDVRRRSCSPAAVPRSSRLPSPAPSSRVELDAPRSPHLLVRSLYFELDRTSSSRRMCGAQRQKVRLIDDVSFEVKAGQMLGIMAPNGLSLSLSHI